MSPWILALLLVATSGIGYLAWKRRYGGVPPALADRPELSLQEARAEFYPELNVSAEEFADLWNDVAKAFEVPAGRIRPTDRFGIELPLRSYMGMTDEDLALGMALTRRCRERGITAQDPVLATVDDYIRFLAGVGRKSGRKWGQR